MNKKFAFWLFFALLTLSAMNLTHFTINTSLDQQIQSHEESNFLHLSSSNRSNIVVFSNTSSFDSYIKERFFYYGGILKNNREWNGIFNSVSGFAGSLPSINVTSFSEEFSEINIEKDEEIETYLNYASVQTGAMNSTWFINGFNGNTNATVAVIDSGIDSSHDFLQGKIIGEKDFTDDGAISDDYGHGTFISSVIAGTGTDSPNSLFPSILTVDRTYSHLDLFEEYLPSKYYSFKISSFNATDLNSNIVINSSWNLIEPGIDDVWFELYYDSNLVNDSHNLMQNVIYNINHQVSQDGEGVYDLYMKYHKQLNKIPKFSFDINISYYPESYHQDVNHFTGIANASKLVSFKVINGSGIGYASDLISAMASLLNNRTLYHIVSACLSIGTLGNDVKAINRAINDVIDSGIVMVIAAGNYGIESSNPLNRLSLSENSIVIGAINDKDQVTSYSSAGMLIKNDLIKPDLVAPGGSSLPGHRSILSAKEDTDKATTLCGTSISAAITSAAVNILIDSKWGDWAIWNSQNPSTYAKMLKALLLMTASETNLDREDDPMTGINESLYSPTSYSGTPDTLKDVHEGYGRINIVAAIDALKKHLFINQSIQGKLTSSKVNPLGQHVFARRVNLDPDKQYIFELTVNDDEAEFEAFLFANSSKPNGEPILYQSTRKLFGDFNSFYFTPKKNQTECIIIVKAYTGESDFTLNFSNIQNHYAPELKIPEVNYIGGVKNSTILSYQEFLGYEPNKNYSIDTYQFYIDYYDLDETNVPPQEVIVSILETSQNISLTQANIFDDNYTDGALFWSSYIQFPEAGIYNYFFYASDGDHIVRLPITGFFNITIEFPTDSEQFPYSYDFKEGWNNWTTIGTGWDILNQSNLIDNRSQLYDNDWNALYYGREHNFPETYTYQPYIITDPYPNGSLISPLFNLTRLDEEVMQPHLKFGLRMSINELDYIYFQINLNWTGWITLRIYTNEEREWFMEFFNLTEYIGYFVQFRFLINVDDQFDPYQYKGLMLDYFSLFNYTNNYSPIIEFNISKDISDTSVSEFEPVIFSCRYFDQDNNYPTYLYLEIDESNFTMINSIGDWSVGERYKEGTGIFFTKSIIIGELADYSFRFHTSDGKFTFQTPFYNLDNNLFNFEDPEILSYNVVKDERLIGYSFSNEDLDDYYITGNPLPKESTSWLMGDNTWHLVERLTHSLIYGGKGQSYGGLENGYDDDWEIQLITKPILLRDEYDAFLTYSFEISLQNEFGISEEDLDRCSVFISVNYGLSWTLLKEYLYDSEDLSGNESINLSSYGNDVIMIMFSLKSNDIEIGSGYGWLISDVYIGYDPDTDFIAPAITALTLSENQIVRSIHKIQFNISDNKEIDSTKIYLYIDDRIIDRSLLSYDIDSNILEYNWDTTKYNDGNHNIRIKVYDMEGNWMELELSVRVQNGWFNLNNIAFWLIISGFITIMGILTYFIVKKSRMVWISKREDLSAEKEPIIKKIELLGIEEELNRPLTLYCRFCKSWFQTPKFEYICPVCGHDRIYVAYNCLNCGKWYLKDEPAQNHYCDNKKCEGIRLIRRGKGEVEDLLAKDGKVLKPFNKDKNKFSILD